MRHRFENLEPELGGQRFNALRDRKEGTDVSTLELFFDVVYVFAIGQISHLLIAHLDWKGALEAAMVTIALWWVWIDTTWITNWFDPRKVPVRLMMIGLMGMSLLMSVAIPEAFGGRSEWFAIAYVTIQVGRSALCLFMLGKNEQAANFARITAWAMLTAPLWLAGGFIGGDGQLVLWGVALLIDSAGPAMGFRIPVLGASETKHWTIAGGHLAERCQLFIIVALGESILLTGMSLTYQKDLTWEIAFAFLAAFSISVMMWWVYFSRSGRATEIFENAKDPGGMGRAYTYFHIPMVAGIVTMAVANEKVIAHPTGSVDAEFVWVAVGGGVLYMFGNAVFNSRITDAFPKRRTITLLAICTVIPFAHLLNPTIVMFWVLAPFVGLALIDGLTAPPPYKDLSGNRIEGDGSRGEPGEHAPIDAG